MKKKVSSILIISSLALTATLGIIGVSNSIEGQLVNEYGSELQPLYIDGDAGEYGSELQPLYIDDDRGEHGMITPSTDRHA